MNGVWIGTENKTFDGAANTLVGQVNLSQNANAAILLGAGNVVKNSYFDVDMEKVNTAADAFGKGDITGAITGLQAAVEASGGKVMAIGGGNTVDGAYYSQLMGVNNRLTGTGEYTSDSATKLNYLEGFHNTGENIQNSYMIGSYNTIKNGKHNIVYGDNQSMDGVNNNVVIGSADSEQTLSASGAVQIGHNAKVEKDGGVAIGEGSIASVDKGVAGYDPSTKAASTETSSAWVATNAAVSVGDGSTLTRQITGVAAGYADTDAVNVAQLKKMSGATNETVQNIDKRVTTNTDNITKLGNQVTTNTDNITKLGDQVSNINQNVDNMGHKINNLDSKINKVGAGAAALAALHPQDFDPDDKWDFAAGFGNYRDANAMAIGAFYRPDNKTMFSVGGSMGNGENMVNVGVSLKFGKSSPYAGMSKAALVNTIEDMKAKDAKRDEVISQQQKEIEDLKAAVAKLMAK